MSVEAYIVYDFLPRTIRPGRVDGVSPWEVFRDLGAEVETGNFYGVFGPGTCVGFVMRGSAPAIVAECNRRGWTAVQVAPAPAVLAKCKKHPDFAAFADDLHLDTDGRVAGWPEPNP